MRAPVIAAAVLVAATVQGAGLESGTKVFESSLSPMPETMLDRLVYNSVIPLNFRPAICSDAVFVRRAYLDVIGTLPTAQEAREFIQDPDVKNKRRLLIDKLLERDEFAAYWAMKWGDILRIKAEFPVNLWPNAAQAYHRWVTASIAENKPYDKFVREMLTSSGSNFRVGPVNFYRAIQQRTPEGIAMAVALTFMGTRTDGWSKEKLQGMAAFFSQVGYKPSREWKEEIVFWDPMGLGTMGTNAPPAATTNSIPASVTNKPPAKTVSQVPFSVAGGEPALLGAAPPSKAPAPNLKPTKPAAPKPSAPVITIPLTPTPTVFARPTVGVFPDGTKVKLTVDRDPREVFADWLITPKNPWFTKNIANRLWAWLLGRGIIHEPDDIRDDNRPTNPALLALLEKEMIAGKYDLKRMYRLILNSKTYQFSSMPRPNVPLAEVRFGIYGMRRLEAEVLIDAVNKITGATDLYTSPIPEPFTYIPQDKPAVALADGSITSPFLALFGRSARATGMENERINKPVPSQWMHMLNSSHIYRKIDQGPKIKALFDPKKKQEEIVEELYLTVLSRFPTEDEVKNIQAYGRVGGPKRREDWVDIIWSLINSVEFQYRH